MSSSISVALGPTDFNELETTHFGWHRHAAAKSRSSASHSRDLLNRLEASAKRHKRPLNPEIIARLELSLSEEDLMIRVVEVIREVDSKRTEPKQ